MFSQKEKDDRVAARLADVANGRISIWDKLVVVDDTFSDSVRNGDVLEYIGRDTFINERTGDTHGVWRWRLDPINTTSLLDMLMLV